MPGPTRAAGRPRRCRACRSCGRRGAGTSWWLPGSLRDPRRDVGLQAVPAALAAVPRLLVAAERRRGVELVEGVRPDPPGAQLVRHPEDPRPLLRPDAR